MEAWWFQVIRSQWNQLTGTFPDLPHITCTQDPHARPRRPHSLTPKRPKHCDLEGSIHTALEAVAMAIKERVFNSLCGESTAELFTSA